MSMDILKMLIQSACSEGSISQQDKALLVKKASELGISEAQLEQLIQDELNPQPKKQTPIEPEKKVIDTNQSGFITDNDSTQNISTNNVDTNLNQKNQSQFSDVSTFESQGAMSLVQKGKLHGKWIIIKRIKPQFKTNEKYKELFYKEFENAYHLDHPNVIRLLDKGEDSEGAYYTMEFVDGRPLTQIIAPGGIRDERLIKKIITQILDGLAYVHKKQVFHRDLKPDNILVTYKGDNVKILDFGLAAADSFDDDLVKVGTPKYAAPEQMTKGNMIDQRADIFSIGLILLEMLTGAITDKTASGIKSNNYKTIITKCLKDNPNDRFYDCQEILDILAKPDTIVEQQPVIENKQNELKQQLEKLKIDADSAFNSKDYHKAQSLYAQYLAKEPTDNYCRNQIEKCRNLMSKTQSETTTGTTKKFPLIPVAIAAVAVIALIVVAVIFKDKLFGSGDVTKNDTTNTNKNNTAEQEFVTLKRKADSLFLAQMYSDAKTTYDLAIAKKQGDVEVLNAKQKVEKILKFKKEALDYFSSKNIARAYTYYDSVLVLMPTDKESVAQKAICETIFNKVSFFKLKIQKESSSNKVGLLDRDGNVIVDYLYDNFGQLHGKLLWAVKKDGKWAVMDKNRNIICNFDYHNVVMQPHGFDLIKDGRVVARAKSDGQKGYID